MSTLHSAQNRALDNRGLLRIVRGRVLTANAIGVAEVDVAVTRQPPAAVRAEAVRRPRVVHVDDEPPHVCDGLRFLHHLVWPHPPRGAVDERDKDNKTVDGGLIGARHVNVHRSHGPSRARCRLSRQSGAYTLRLHAFNAWLKHACQCGSVLSSRSPQQVLAQVAGENWKWLMSISLTSFPMANGRLVGASAAAAIIQIPGSRACLSDSARACTAAV